MQSFTPSAAELQVVISTQNNVGAPNNVVIYVPYGRRDLQHLACKIVNSFILDDHIHFTKASIKMVDDTTVIDGTTKLASNMIYFELGNLQSHVDTVEDHVFSWQYYITKIMNDELALVFQKEEPKEE
jgi:hypothetical protein